MERFVYIDKEKFLLRKGESYRVTDGMFMYRYTDELGKRKALYAKDLDELRSKVRKTSSLTASSTYSIDELFTEWSRTKCGIRQHTWQNYKWLYDSYVRGKFGKRRVSEITFGEVVRFYISLKEEAHLAITTIDGVQTVLQQVFGYAVRQGYISSNPCAGAMTDMKRATAKREILIFSNSEQTEFLKFCREYHPEWYGMFATMLFSGMRCGELCGLQWGDVDFENNRISIQHNLIYYPTEHSMSFEMAEPKTKAGVRSFAMSSMLRDALLCQRDKRKLSRVCIDGYDDFVFVTKMGTTFQQGTINKVLRRIIADYNSRALDEGKELLPVLSSHSLRKSFCCRLAEAGVPLKVAAEVMGHSDSRTTFGIYMTVSKEWGTKELQQFDDYMKMVQCTN